MIDTNYKYAQWSMNVNPYGMHWQTYHDGRWYNANEMTYDEAVESLKPEVIAKIRKDHPHLTAFDLNQNEVIQVNNKYMNANIAAPSQKIAFVKEECEPGFIKAHGEANYEILNSLSKSDEKINKGTIEEQIEACALMSELNSFRLIAEMNPKLKAIFDSQEKKIQESGF